MYNILNGVRVIDCSSWVFMPSACAVLRDWGADVIKVEDPRHGDPIRGLVLGGADGEIRPSVELVNRGKRSIGLDITRSESREVLHRLVASADVFVTSMLPSVRRRHGLDVTDLRAINPRLIYVRSSGYGPHGPTADRRAFDLVSAWAEGGAVFGMTEPEAAAPVQQAGSFGDLVGGLTAAGAVSAALYRRQLTGEPAVVDVALQNVGMYMMGQMITSASSGAPFPRHDRTHPSNPLVNSYRTSDDRWIFLCFLQADKFWADLCRRLGNPELIENGHFATAPLRGANSAKLVTVLDSIFAKQPLVHWQSAFHGMEGPWGIAKNGEEILTDEVVRSAGFLTEVGHAGGTFQTVATPAQFDQVPLGPSPAAPEVGQNTEEVLLELGYTWDDIALLKESGLTT
jgi:crotonobetainyl-CoA:carnitine CoA-transferase CaiB-like acyl-CoA transferase